ncbi:MULTISPECIES: FAS1-like dehydratase domain-containing protein [Noviherbaspirillum]|uniref:FAS1-like dehydratase domain-containing protein n=1 Tax=Noviherbaspirillum TaxID=1344552 RepID=UPI00124E0FD9|nr:MULTISPECIES: MaoC family dehydratase N-terminal domain-containing protein [Noviherbaspirillum]
MTEQELQALQSWVGRSKTVVEVLSPVPARSLAATLSLPVALHPRDILPPLWHWLYFHDDTPSDQLGEDGAPRTGALMPPVPLEQLMWAGAEFEFLRPLRIGVETSKRSTIAEMRYKSGRRGPMVFVTWEHCYEQDRQPAVIERSRAVFLGASDGTAAVPDAPVSAGRAVWPVNEAVLFRYSALTFNSHRIHYDRDYAREIGGYPGLIVHGPLQATLLAESYRAWHPERPLAHAVCRARAPLFLGAPVIVHAGREEGDSLTLWTEAGAGGMAMEAVFSSQAAGNMR